MTDVAHRFAAAFTAKDVEQLLDCFTEDAVYHDLVHGRFTGRDGLRSLFERTYADGCHHKWRMDKVVDSPACTVGEWHYSFTVNARTLAFGGMSVFETQAGRCHTYREYFDRGAALLALGISPAAAARIAAQRPSVEVTAADADR